MNKWTRTLVLGAALGAELMLAAGTFAQGGPPMQPPPGGFPHHGKSMPPQQQQQKQQPGAPQPALKVQPALSPSKDVTTANGESFFIVASIDLAKSTLLLKRPTEVTLVVDVTDKTKFVDETGKAIKFSDLRAGDTVWMTSSGDPAQPTAIRVRKGQMTAADLHRYYLDYPEIK